MRSYQITSVLRSVFIIGLFMCSFLSAQNSGLKKTVTDSNTGITFNNFRTDKTEAVFFQVLKPVEFLYDAPANNAEPVYSLSAGMFVEVIEDSRKGNYMQARVLDKFNGVIEGWIRISALKKDRYYAASYSEIKNIPENGKRSEMKINPHWIRQNTVNVFSDSTLSGNIEAVLSKGDLVYVLKFSNEICRIGFEEEEGVFKKGYVVKKGLSEFAVISDALTDTDSLYSRFNGAVLRNDLDKSGFVSYSGIAFKGLKTEEFTEDKVCREISPDSILYRYSRSSDPMNRSKHIEVRNEEEKRKIAMFRFLPDEKMITSRDTVECSVVEIVAVPKSASIITQDIEQATITNTIHKIYITRLEKFEMDLVFHREVYEFTWSYSKDLTEDKITDTSTETEKIIKRLIAFRKH
ncbi:MAG: hypothetical protein R6V47_03490 [Candidatus Delongbacteria bacterium]